ncbi:MAG TPA: adenine deaminase C-terminal domain-containing protein, partial [Bradyrhizobium sp.]
AELPVVNGNVESDTARDVLKVAVIDRHKATPKAGVGFVRGFRLKRGALAASTNCDDMNIVVLGASDTEMIRAVRAVADIGGGFAVVDGDNVLYSVPLPIAGCMSDQPWEAVADQSRACDRAAEAIGCEMRAPFMIMSFIGLSVVPDLGLTELGLVDTSTQAFTDVVLGLKGGLVCCRCPSHAHDVHKMMGSTGFRAVEV